MATALEAPKEELTATQYVILAESQRKKRALAETRLKYNALVEENKRLLLDRNESERHTFEIAAQVTEFMRREILAKNGKIAQLEKAADDQKRDYEAKLKTLKHRLESNESAAQLRYDEMESELTSRLDTAMEELAAVNEFKALKESMERELLTMREQNDALQTKLEESEREQQRRFLEATTKLKKDFEQKLEEVKKRYEEDMDDRLDASVKRILQQNRRTAQELQLHMEESEQLQTENRILEDERKRLMQELQIKLQMEQGYIQRNAKQARSMAEANEKMFALERTLQSLVDDFEKERDYMRKQWNKATNDMQREVQGYKRLVELKTKELKNIRRLGQEVLLQRSDAEIFLISSIQHVRKEIELEHEPTQSHRKHSQVDISQLSWSDREKVLRLVFAKINNQARQAHFMSLPAHSFEAKTAAGPDPGEQVPDPAHLQGLRSDAGPTQLV